MTTIASLAVQLTAETRSFTGGIRNAVNSVFSLRNSVIGLIGTAGFGALVRSSISSADQIGKLSLRLGEGVEALSRYRYVTGQAGIDFESFATSLQRQTRRISDATRQTSGPVVQALNDLGLKADDLVKLSPLEAFRKIADAINKIEDPAKQVAIAFGLWDTEGVKNLELIKQGRDAIDAYEREADDLGRTLSRDQVEAADKANKAMKRLGNRFIGVRDDVVLELAPAITRIIDRIEEAAPKLKPFVDGFGDIIERVGGAGEAIDALAGRLDTFWQGVKPIIRLGAGLGAAQAGLIESTISGHPLVGLQRFALTLKGAAQDFARDFQPLAGLLDRFDRLQDRLPDVRAGFASAGAHLGLGLDLARSGNLAAIDAPAILGEAIATGVERATEGDPRLAKKQIELMIINNNRLGEITLQLKRDRGAVAQ